MGPRADGGSAPFRWRDPPRSLPATIEELVAARHSCRGPAWSQRYRGRARFCDLPRREHKEAPSHHRYPKRRRSGLDQVGGHSPQMRRRDGAEASLTRMGRHADPCPPACLSIASVLKIGDRRSRFLPRFITWRQGHPNRHPLHVAFATSVARTETQQGPAQRDRSSHVIKLYLSALRAGSPPRRLSVIKRPRRPLGNRGLEGLRRRKSERTNPSERTDRTAMASTVAPPNCRSARSAFRRALSSQTSFHKQRSRQLRPGR